MSDELLANNNQASRCPQCGQQMRGTDWVDRLLEQNRTQADEIEAIVHDCIAIAEHCKTGAAMEVGGKQYPLGIMAADPAEAQRLTAVAIAQAIRCRYGLGE